MTEVLIRDIAEELKDAYLDYAMSVIIGRALPDVRDGLKPVQRRILYAMYEMGLTRDRPHVKCARVVGHVLGNYHPHGDQPVYDALVRMAQDFSMRYPLIDGQGNFGSIDGDEPAAMRYTECRLTEFAEEMLRDIEKSTVDFQPNFDASKLEPVVLPSRVPNLIVNGCTGIAVGMMTNIPPHNISEVCRGIIAYIKNPNISVEELMEYIRGPDFPTGGVIVGREGIVQAYKTGRGKIVLRGKVEVEGDRIVIREIPYMVNKAKLVEKIADLIRKDKLLAKTVRDESDRDGIRVVIELKEDPLSALKKLYAHTPLKVTFNVIMLALMNNEPRLMNLKELIAHYVDHRREVLRRKARYELKKAEERIHIVEGLMKAMERLDEVVELIRGSKSVKDARDSLTKLLGITDVQADAILQMRLQMLTKLEVESLKKEYEELSDKIDRLKEILSNPKKVDEIIIDELEEIRRRFGDGRRTEIVESDELKITKEFGVVVCDGSILRLNLGNSVGCKPDFALKASDEDTILLFSEDKAYSIECKEIPFDPTPLSKFISVENVETGVIARGSVVLLSKDGNVKKVKAEEFSNAKRAGVIAGERIGFARLYEEGDVIVATRKGYVVRFRAEEIPEYGRTAKGIKAVSLREGDEISWLSLGEGDYVLILTRDGYAKRVPIEEFRLTARGAMGVLGAKGEIAVAEIIKEDVYYAYTEDGRVVKLNVRRIPVEDRYGRGKRIANSFSTLTV